MSDPISIFPLFVENQTFPPAVATVRESGDLQVVAPENISTDGSIDLQVDTNDC